MDEVVYHKINYQGSSKVIKRLCEESGNLVDYKADKSEIPVNISDLYNDSGFITNLVDDLANYYLKSETYTQAEVNSLIGAISTLHIEVVQTLPTEDISTNTIYLVPKQTAGQNDTYDEYIYVNNNWEHIGSTDIDLTNYYTKTETDALLDDKVDKVTGKGLSTEDYTTAEKTKLSGIETGAQVNVKPDWDAAAGADDEILNKPSLATVATTGDYDDLTNKPQNLVQDANYVHTDNNYTTAEKTKLAGIEAGAQVNVEPLIGTTLNTTPSQVLNAIQNGVPVSITHTDATYGAGTVTSFYYSAVNNAVIGSTVAKVYNGGQVVGYLLFELMGHTTANNWTMYNTMLAEKTDIPDELADLTDDSTHRLVTDTEKAAWNAKSDFSGSYNDLTDKPTIPDELADLQDDATHRLVTDTEKTMWNGKSVVTANPASTTESLASIEIDGVGYSISGGGGSVNAWLNTGGTNLNPASDNLIDLNDYTTPGVYYCSDNSKSQYVSNRPTNNVQVFTLVVQKVGSAVSNWRQIYYEAGATPRMYYRAKNGSSSSWQEWKSEALSSDIPTSWKLTHDTTLIDATSSNPVDLNDIATPGTYHANDGNVAYISNKPALATQTKRFLLVVQNISNTANAYQIYMEGSQSRWFIRNTTNYGSTWSAWAQIAYADKMWRLAEGTQLNATSESRLDLNTIDAAGTYYTPNETSGPYIDHKPVESNNRFTLIVQALGNADSNRVRQIYQSIGTHDIYERYRNGTSANWSSWRRFVYDNEIPQPLIGTTATVTPSQVLDALQAGRPIYIAYTESESGANVTLGYSDFTYIDLTGNIYSTLLTSSQGHPVMMALTGNISTDTWSGYTAVLAEQSDIPDELADLDDDSTHRLVTDTEKTTWNGKSDFSGSYNDLTDKPTIPAAQVNSDWNASSGLAKILNKPTLAAVATSGSYNDLSNKPTIPAAQVNADWNASSGVAQILNKPTIPAAQVNSNWNATSGVAQILNKPSSLPASDVYAWAKAATKPSYTASEVGALASTTKYASSSAVGGAADLAKKLIGSDTRSTNANPSSYFVASQNSTIITEFKQRTTIGAPGSSTYGLLVTFTPWTDSSGGFPVQLYLDNTGQRAIRYATNATTWGSWNTLAYTSSNITGTSANVTGTVAVANGGTGATTAANARTNLGTPGISADANGFYTVTKSDGTGNWIRCAGTNYGFLPSVAGSAGSGTGYLGTSSWYWGNVYTDKINGVAVGSSPKFTDNNTTYTFAGGTNKFTVTPSGGSAQTVTITPSITNNVTGSGTSGYIAKFNGANTITNGPAFGSATTTFLRNDGSWATPTASWSGGTITSAGKAYSSSGKPVGWYAGYGSTDYMAMLSGQSGGSTGLLDVVANAFILSKSNSLSGISNWRYAGRLATSRFQCGSLVFTQAGSKSITFSPAFAGVPVVLLTTQGSANTYVRVTACTASTVTIYSSSPYNVNWYAYYDG